jgi:hypothetical protein
MVAVDINVGAAALFVDELDDDGTLMSVVSLDIEASEITSAVRTQLHSVTPWAGVDGTEVTYPEDRSSE